MAKTALNKLGLAAVILLAPGGFILGTALVVRQLRRRREADPDALAHPPTSD